MRLRKIAACVLCSEETKFLHFGTAVSALSGLAYPALCVTLMLSTLSHSPRPPIGIADPSLG